ncbi:hypothetical protein H206_02695 [Candidatus Electrothrix aarhusensis]|uniref:Uncharacterized protein n=1 Tax=Candidatus Electrothrix aarhusensis TaxID=1859131 RepID=A0A444IXH3_9BACT|nr:hypothetical protein H206_02695 [Candidatus Electrothrix aarhusensis]
MKTKVLKEKVTRELIEKNINESSKLYSAQAYRCFIDSLDHAFEGDEFDQKKYEATIKKCLLENEKSLAGAVIIGALVAWIVSEWIHHH